MFFRVFHALDTSVYFFLLTLYLRRDYFLFILHLPFLSYFLKYVNFKLYKFW